MRKDDSRVNEWCSHTRNAAVGKSGVNKRVRQYARQDIRDQLDDCEGYNTPPKRKHKKERRFILDSSRSVHQRGSTPPPRSN